jgi:hypothetical protein
LLGSIAASFAWKYRQSFPNKVRLGRVDALPPQMAGILFMSALQSVSWRIRIAVAGEWTE